MSGQKTRTLPHSEACKEASASENQEHILTAETENALRDTADAAAQLSPHDAVEEREHQHAGEEHTHDHHVHEHDGCCEHSHEHHEHDHEHHDHDSCCEHDHAHHDHDSCCEHDHAHHHHDHDACGCGHHHEDGDVCGCGHNHGELEEDDLKKQIIQFAISAGLFVIALLASGWIKLPLFLAAYLVAGLPVLLSAARNIVKGRVFDENFLMSIATIGAFILGEYPEGVAVMLFYNIGELLSDVAVGRSRKSIAALMDLKPETATRLAADGTETVVLPEDVAVGEMILVRPGERIPLDGVVIAGEGFVDNSALTGESVPVSVAEGESVLSGGVCGSGVLTIRTTTVFANSAVSRILELTQEAADKKAPTERFLTRFAAVYTPCIVIAALVIAFLPPLFGLGSLSTWVYRALTILVVSCPCALVLSVPLGFFGGIGRASKMGVLVKGGESLEMLDQVSTMVFDKTGTLTTGQLRVQRIVPIGGMSEQDCLSLAAAVEQYSNHPAASAVEQAHQGALQPVSGFSEVSGKGVCGTVNGKRIAVGNRRLMEAEQVENIPEADGTVLFIACDGQYIGRIEIADTIRPEAKDAVQLLHAQGVRNTVMLTGDTKRIAESVAGEIGIDTVHASLLPEDKVTKLTEVLQGKPEKTTVAYVGDGINDAPVLKTADIGIAMGAAGTDAAVEAADVVIMTDNLMRLPDAVRVSKYTKKIIKQNIVFALGIKALVLALTFFGLSTMWEAVFADVGVCVLTVLNATRILKMK